MEQPLSFVTQRESFILVCCLHKSLYSVKQSPKRWYGRFNEVFQQFGMTLQDWSFSVLSSHNR